MYDNLYTGFLGYFNPYIDLYSETFDKAGGPAPETGFIVDELNNPIIDELGFAIEYVT